ncbi:MAG: formate dehydrogenase accessory sulfurtransferase FdhD [Caulobacteraceae bacterium]
MNRDDDGEGKAKMTLEAVKPLHRLRWRASGALEAGDRLAAEETPIAIVHDGSTTAVMMATPADLEEFAIGFSLTEGIIATPQAISGIEAVEGTLGIEVRLWLAAEAGARLASRRRRLAGPTGCGLCGVESLAAAVRPIPRLDLDDLMIEAGRLITAMDALPAAQPLGAATRAVHAAALWREGEELIVREDVGRHNALDKLVGACARRGITGRGGAVLLTSRVSVEMVQKAAVLGAPIICAISAPTALAVRTAAAAGVTLVGVTRSDGFEIFTHPRRIATALSGGRKDHRAAGSLA